MANPGSRWNGMWVHIALVAVSAFVTIAGVEIALRAVSPRDWGDDPTAMLERAATRRPPPFAGSCDGQAAQAKLGALIRPSADPDRIYELKPSLDTCYYGVRVTTNRDGFRAAGELARPKPGNAYRILLLGDSQTFGQGVAFEDTFGELLARSLAEDTARTVEVINTGVDGYNTVQEAAVLRARGLGLEPDCILVLFIGNDMELPGFLLEPRGILSPDRWLLTNRLKRLIAWARAGGGSQGAAALAAPDHSRVPAKYAHLVGEEAYRRALRDLAGLAGDIPLVDFADYSSGRGLWSGMEGYQRDLGILVPSFEFPTEPEYWLSQGNRHLNREGHRLLAARMRAGLEELGVCLPPPR